MAVSVTDWNRVIFVAEVLFRFKLEGLAGATQPVLTHTLPLLG